MPLYEFNCQDCDKHFEFILRIGETKRKCPECKGKLKKVVFCKSNYHDTYSPMHPRKGRGVGGYGRVNPG